MEENDKGMEDAKLILEELRVNTDAIEGKINAANGKLEELQGKLNDDVLNRTIIDVRTSIQAIKDEVVQKKADIDSKIEEINSFYNNDYLPLKEQTTDPTTGINQVLSEAKDKSNAISNYEAESKTQFEVLAAAIENYTARLTELMKLEEYHKTVREAQDSAAQLLNQADLVKVNVQEANARLEDLKLQINENDSLFKVLTTIQENIEVVKLNIENNKSDIESKCDEIATFYTTEYLQLRDKVLNPSDGIQNILETSQSKLKSISEFEEQSRLSLDNLQNSINQYKIVFDSLKAIEVELESFFKESKIEGQNQLNQIKNLNAAADTFFKKIRTSQDESEKIKANINGTLEESQKTHEDIKEIKKESKNIKNELNAIYEQATNETLGGAFGMQVGFLKTELTEWGNKVQLWTCILIGTIVLLFIVHLKCNSWQMPPLDASFFLRYTITTPIIFYLAFCTKQYSIIRASLDKYIFKKNMALSVEAHTSLLKLNFPAAEKQRLEFSMGVMNKIYDVPYYDEGMKVQHKMMMEQMKFASAKHNLNEYLNSNVKLNSPGNSQEEKEPIKDVIKDMSAN